MAYVSLYRKYRSQSFEDVQGQDHVTRTLQNAIKSGRVAHAYLFCGPRGTGKTSTARLLAKALNCDNPRNGEPCNTCGACVEITEGRHLDVREIDAASNRGIDDIRDLRDTVAFAPSSGKKKVYVIDEVHQVTNEGFNALLKTLEEPPPHVVFVLATTETHKVPATIVSRCQRFEFRRASVEQLRERVAWVAEREGAKIEPVALDLIARDANGGWRDALSLLEQVLAFSEEAVTARDVYAVLGTVEADTLCDLAEAILAEDGATVFATLDRLICEGKDPRQLLRDVTAYFRSAMLAAAGSPPAGEPEVVARLLEQSRRYGQSRLVQAIEVLAQTEREARWSEQPRLLLELALVRLMHPRQMAASAPAARAAAPQRSAAPPQAEPPRDVRPVAARPDPVRSQSATPVAPVSRPAPPAVTASPFVDEPVAAPSFHSALSAEAELPPPPLTVGDARAGDDGDDDFAALFDTAPSIDEAAPPPISPVVDTPQTVEFVAPPPPPAGSFQPSAGSVDLIRKKWHVVMEELKRAKKMNVYVFLADVQPDRFEGDELVLLFSSKSFAEEFPKKGKAFSDPLTTAIAKITGVQCRVRAQHKGAASPGAAVAARPFAGTSAAATPKEGTSTEGAAAIAVSPVAGAAAATATRPPGPARGAEVTVPSGLVGEDLTHSIIDIYDGRVVEDREL